MELEVVISEDKDLENEMAQINAWGKSGMLASFESMKKLLCTLDDVMPKNAFLRKWMKTKL